MFPPQQTHTHTYFAYIRVEVHAWNRPVHTYMHAYTYTYSRERKAGADTATTINPPSVGAFSFSLSLALEDARRGSSSHDRCSGSSAGRDDINQRPESLFSGCYTFVACKHVPDGIGESSVCLYVCVSRGGRMCKGKVRAYVSLRVAKN